MRNEILGMGKNYTERDARPSHLLRDKIVPLLLSVVSLSRGNSFLHERFCVHQEGVRSVFSATCSAANLAKGNPFRFPCLKLNSPWFAKTSGRNRRHTQKRLQGKLLANSLLSVSSVA